VVRSFPVCKACWVYHPYNTGADAFKEAPVRRVCMEASLLLISFFFCFCACQPCSCPADTVSGAKTDSGCALHVGKSPRTFVIRPGG
jgi:hypothetical protein